MDDTIFYASSQIINSATKKLQKQKDTANPWFHQWKITVNSIKTKAIMFGNKSTVGVNKIKFRNNEIQKSSSVKYLGVKIDRKLKFVSHTRETKGKPRP